MHVCRGAYEEGKVNYINILIENGAHVNVSNTDNQTARQLAKDIEVYQQALDATTIKLNIHGNYGTATTTLNERQES